MRIALVGTYPPTACGIATFTADVSQALRGAGLDVVVVPVVHGDETTEAAIHIDKDDRGSYVSAAHQLNRAAVDVVLVQHEFGIFAGRAGNYVVDFINALTIPVAATLHTVLSPYSTEQADVIRRLCDRASVVTVFTATARRLLLEQELVCSDIVSVVAHGAPIELYATFDRSAVRHQFGVRPADRIISTFGLLSPGKGIELALTAMVEIVERHPRTVYVIAGRTHPEVERRDGQCYRQRLLNLIDELGLGDHVVMIDRFLEVQQLAELLAITEVFCTPYAGSDQIVSGALTFAIAAGCPAVSTPYRYARDLLAHGAGTLVDFDDAPEFARAVSELLDGGPRAEAARTAARVAAHEMKWPTVGRALADLVSKAIARRPPIALGSLVSTGASDLIADRMSECDPPIDSMPLAVHLGVLVDDTSILQHARGRVPRIEEGYCVDDAGRALPLLAALAADAQAKGSDPSRWQTALARQLSFLRAATCEPSRMRNFMSWERRWLDEPHHGDHVGRAVWGLGELAAADNAYSDDALELMLDIVEDFDPERASVRTLAYTALGLEAAHSDPTASAHLQRAAITLKAWKPRPGGWRWFEDRLAYDNPRLVETLLRVGYRLDEPQLSDAGAEQLRWLDDLCRRADHYRFPGHLGADAHHDVRWSGDEQPLEATAMADAHAALLEFDDDDADARISIDRAWSWFLGNNRLGVAVGDIATGACHDGLCAHDVNLNCGAESTISFLRCARTWAATRPADDTDTTKATRRVPAE